MRNIWTICRRELYAYFVSPIAWVLLAMFAVLSGFFAMIMSSSFVQETIISQMRSQGQSVPMSINEMVIAPLIGNIAVVSMFFVPLIGMRLFAEEKRQGTIELLVTSPVQDFEIVIGKWLAASLMYAALLAVLLFDISFLFLYGSPDGKPVASAFFGLYSGCCPLGLYGLHLHSDQKSDCRGLSWLRFLFVAFHTELDLRSRRYTHNQVLHLPFRRHTHGKLLARRDR